MVQDNIDKGELVEQIIERIFVFSKIENLAIPCFNVKFNSDQAVFYLLITNDFHIDIPEDEYLKKRLDHSVRKRLFRFYKNELEKLWFKLT